MSVILAFVIIAAACSIITIRNLVGYSDFSPIIKNSVIALVIIGWFGAPILYFVGKYDLVTDMTYTSLHQIFYCMLAFVFILFVCLMLRDIFWFILFRLLKLFDKASWEWDPNNSDKLNKTNFAVIILSFVICFYAAWQANKLPYVEELNFYSDKIKSNVKIVQVSDLHISRTTSKERVKSIVDQVTALSPDAIVLTGDTIGDNINKINSLLDELRELSAPYGIYAIMGEHEFYNNVYDAKKAFEQRGITFLFNGGATIKIANIFIAGIPDYSTMAERINLWRTIYKSKKENYRVLLSHSPLIVDALSKELFDIVLSGRTHGGQFFPVHWFVQKLNHYLAGTYKVNDIDLFVSRGAGTLGPNMRLLAPADIAVVNLHPKQ